MNLKNSADTATEKFTAQCGYERQPLKKKVFCGYYYILSLF